MNHWKFLGLSVLGAIIVCGVCVWQQGGIKKQSKPAKSNTTITLPSDSATLDCPDSLDGVLLNIDTTDILWNLEWKPPKAIKFKPKIKYIHDTVYLQPIIWSGYPDTLDSSFLGDDKIVSDTLIYSEQ